MSDARKPEDHARRTGQEPLPFDVDALADVIAAKMALHPPKCLLGLDAATVQTLTEIAKGYREGKTKALSLLLRLAIWGIFLGVVTAIANIDVKALLKGVFGLNP